MNYELFESPKKADEIGKHNKVEGVLQWRQMLSDACATPSFPNVISNILLITILKVIATFGKRGDCVNGDDEYEVRQAPSSTWKRVCLNHLNCRLTGLSNNREVRGWGHQPHGHTAHASWRVSCCRTAGWCLKVPVNGLTPASS